jgi:two-component system response regulator
MVTVPTNDYILLVEDNDDDVMLTKRALRRLGVTTDLALARDGAEALETVFMVSRGHLPCLVLLDLKLPKYSGAEVLARLRADPSTQDLPVIVLSSSREELELLKTQSLSVIDYVQKTYQHNGFTASLAQVKQFCP